MHYFLPTYGNNNRKTCIQNATRTHCVIENNYKILINNNDTSDGNTFSEIWLCWYARSSKMVAKTSQLLYVYPQHK